MNSSIFRDFRFWYVTSLIGIFGLVNAVNELSIYNDSRNRSKNNSIVIYHNGALMCDRSSRIWDLFLLRKKKPTDYYISTLSQLDFLKQYEQLDKNRDINLVIETNGGSLSSAEAICNYVMNHSKAGHLGKIICHIPHYAHSGGCLIALCCDEIVMTNNSVVSPCDAQKMMGLFSGAYSMPSIMYTTQYKKDKNEKVDEQWLASEFDAKQCIDRQKKFVEKLVEFGRYDGETADKIYDEFFSGKYNHDQIFTAEEAKQLGLNIRIVDTMPDWIKNISK